MSILWLHPAWPLLAAALAFLVLPRRLRPIALLGPGLAVLLVEVLARASPAPDPSTSSFLLQEVQWIRADALGLLFARIFALMGLIGSIYALTERRRATLATAMIYVAGALGVVLAGDLLALFVAWEVKAVASAAVVYFGGRAGSHRAAWRYLLLHTLGGGLLALGIALRGPRHGLAFEAMPLDGQTIWILLAFALSAGIPPLHAWLTESYPEGSPAGSVFLCAFTTKAGVYALIRGFPGQEALVWWGVAMALYGVVFAVLENDIRRLLAYHIVSQVGFMVAAVGMGSAMALDGASAHAFSHILYKGLLFMSTGAVLYATGRSKLTELGGLGRVMPWTLGLYMVGAFSISGVPLFNGFVSKSMVVSAAEAAHRPGVELLLILASVGTFLHTGLKLPWFTFAGPSQGARLRRPVPGSMVVAMTLAAALCLGIGLLPQTFYRILPWGTDYHPYTTAHVITSLLLLLGTAIAFFLLLDKLGGEPTVTRDAHRLYPWVGRAAVGLSRRLVVPALPTASRASGELTGAARRFATRWQRGPVGLWIAVGGAGLALLLLRMMLG